MEDQKNNNRDALKNLLKYSQLLATFTISSSASFPRNSRQVLADRMISHSLDILEEVCFLALHDEREEKLNTDKIKHSLLSLNALFTTAINLDYITPRLFNEFGRRYDEIKKVLKQLV